MIELGKIYKNKEFVYIIRDLKKAVQLFAYAAKLRCQEGYYYVGKEYLIGRILDQNFNKAKKYLLMALKNNGDPRAGYYLYKLSKYIDEDSDDLCFKSSESYSSDENSQRELDDIDDSEDTENDEYSFDDVMALKISVKFGYRRALYKYGHRLISGKDIRIEKNNSEGIELIKQSAEQNYKKAIRFCRLHNISYTKKDNNQECKNISNISGFSSDNNNNNQVDNELIIINDEEKKSTSNIINENENRLLFIRLKEDKKNSSLSSSNDNDKNSGEKSNNEEDISELQFWF